MFSNIDKKDTEADVQLHNEALALCEKHLSYGYVKEAQSRLTQKNIKISDGTIRKIKTGVLVNWAVLEVLVQMAKEKESATERVAGLMAN